MSSAMFGQENGKKSNFVILFMENVRIRVKLCGSNTSEGAGIVYQFP